MNAVEANLSQCFYTSQLYLVKAVIFCSINGYDAIQHSMSGLSLLKIKFS